MKKRIIAILMVICLMAAMAACGKTQTPASPEVNQPSAEPAEPKPAENEAAQPVTIEFMVGNQAMLDWFESYFPQLVSGENEYNITVKAEFQKEATQALQMKAATNEIPDMLCVGLPQEMIREGWFLDVADGPWWDNVFASAKDLAKDIQSGNTYVVPMGSGALGLFYNKDILNELGISELPTSWDEFIEVLELIKGKMPDITPMYLGAKETWSLGHIIEFTLMGAAKQELGYVGYETAMANNDLAALKWNEDASGILSTFARYIMDMNEKGLINKDAVTATTDNLAENFANGKVAFVSQGMWALGGFSEKNPDFKSIGFMAYPTMMAGMSANVGSPLEGSIALSAKSSPEKIAAAKTVLELITSPEAVKSYCEATGTIPVRSDVDANWSFIKDEVKAALSSASGENYTQNLPGAFSSDENGRLVQNILVNAYDTPEAFAQDFLKMWQSAYDAANQ